MAVSVNSPMYAPGRAAMKAARVVADMMAYTPGDLRYVPRWLASLPSRGNQLAAEVPWLPYSAIRFLERQIGPQAVAFEYGGGGSTLWLARRVRHLTTVEHDAAWCPRLAEALQARQVPNVELIACPARPEPLPAAASLPNGMTYGSESAEGSFETYVKTIDQFPDASFDLVIVDGRSRAACLVHAAPKVRPGGLLVLDDSDRPRYQVAKQTLTGWLRREFWGIRPFSLERSHTTCWRRPSDATTIGIRW
ncbi:MAG: class I SAM-dependent methyltransferase [Chloroflexi bacterium]|nr:class I SAM-dependent methyltransferase [Chloroflexota bacterium]